MSTTSSKRIGAYALACLVLFLLFATTAAAQGRLSLSVTPPLFQIGVSKGERWQSALKVVNNNPYPITVWAEVVRFEPVGEEGHGRFQPVIDGELDETVMASWIEMVPGPYNIGAEQSFNIPFALVVPEDAPPGGHSAAILVGTRPPDDTNETVSVSTSQVVTSLLFARIAGDVREVGSIREFSVARLFAPEPRADFTLRFENEGNVHLRPQGAITIYNMWGKERGYIPINQKTAYGNVLPESIRKYEFEWVGEGSLTEIGRYKAIATVGYGFDAKQFSDRTTYFWVIPLKATLGTLVAVLLFIGFIVWAIRQYVRKAMLMAGIDPDAAKRERRVKKQKQSGRTNTDVSVAGAKHPRRATLRAPIRAGVIDLRTRMDDRERYKSRLGALWSFLLQYKKFVLSAVAIIVIAAAVLWYISEARTDERNYEVILKDTDGEIELTSEEIIKERLEEAVENAPTEPTDAATDAQTYDLDLLNASGEVGTAAEVAIMLEALGYTIDEIDVDSDRVQSKSAIVYDQTLEAVAVQLSGQLGGVPVSQSPATTTDRARILLIVGGDQISQ